MACRLALAAALTAFARMLATAPPTDNDHEEIRNYRVDKLLAQTLCTPTDNDSLASGLVYYHPDGQCYSIASRGPCSEGSAFFVDKHQALNASGRIRGTCVKELSCPDPLVTSLAYDGSCRSLTELVGICTYRTVLNVFGETECVCYGSGCSVPQSAACPIQRAAQWPNPQFNRYRGGAEGNFKGRRFPCSGAERECLRYGRLLHEADGRCYLLGERGPCPTGQTFRVDKQEALEGSGRFRGRCVNDSSCPEQWYVRMAYDGSCRSHHEANVICSHIEGYSLATNIFGERVCECSECPREPFDGTQPDSEGSCVFPDITQAKLPVLTPWRLPNVPCTEEELSCFSEDRIYYERTGTCEELRSNGPCGEGEWLVADSEEGEKLFGRLVAGCRPRPCPPGEVLMLYDGRCHAEVEVNRKVCSGRPIVFDAFGRAACGAGSERSEQLPKYSLGRGFCSYSVAVLHVPGSIGRLAPPRCPASDSGSCAPGVVAAGDGPGLE